MREPSSSVNVNTGVDGTTTIQINVQVPKTIAVHPQSFRFYELLGQMGLLHASKQMDYGKEADPFANVRASEEWGMAPWVGAMVRISDKIRRLQMFAQRGDLANESAEDSMLDIAVYQIIGLILYQDSQA